MNDLKIKIKIDKDTGELVVTQKEMQKLGTSIKSAENK